MKQLAMKGDEVRPPTVNAICKCGHKFIHHAQTKVLRPACLHTSCACKCFEEQK